MPQPGDILLTTLPGKEPTRMLYSYTTKDGLFKVHPLGAIYSSYLVDPEAVEPAPPLPCHSGYDYNEIIYPRIMGLVPWGHIEEINVLDAANAFAAGGATVVPNEIGYINGKWSRFMLSTRQGGGFTGEATALTWGSGHYAQDPAKVARVISAAREILAGKSAAGDLAAVLEDLDANQLYQGNPHGFRVAVCKHEKVPGSGANPQRGWHPGSCRLCGMDLTVDSGD